MFNYNNFWFLQVKRPTIIVGGMSSGKTVAIKHFMRSLESKYYVNIIVIRKYMLIVIC